MQLHSLCLGPLMTNCYIVWNDDRQALIIDPANDADQIIAFIESEQLVPRAILLTHSHIDHIVAVPAVARKYELQVYLDPDDLIIYNSPRNDFPPFLERVEDLPETVAQLDLQIDGLAYEVIRTPGHSPGSVGFLFADDKLMISGDTLFQSSIGRTDLPGGDSTALVDSIRNVLYRLPPEIVVHPGHGPATTIATEMGTNPFVRGG
jgi:glyoxylase-like metal-dependent hydrolase (beta-lactamase superfamily II)